jgi:hypothetical protein
LPQARSNFLEVWRAQTGPSHHDAQRVGIVGDRNAAQQGGFDGSGASAHERIVNEVTGLSQPFDEEARQLRLKAGSVGDLVQGAGLALPGGPKLVDESRYRGARTVWHRNFRAEFPGWVPKFPKCCQFIRQREMRGRTLRWGILKTEFKLGAARLRSH